MERPPPRVPPSPASGPVLFLIDWLHDRSLTFVVLGLLACGSLWLAMLRPSATTARWPLASSVVRSWAGALALTALFLLCYEAAAWLGVVDLPFAVMFRVGEVIDIAVAVPLVHVLWQTVARPWRVVRDRADPLARRVAWFGWVALSAVLVAWGHGFFMHQAFPTGGGEFHAMFAYTDAGRLDQAYATWWTSVTTLAIVAALLVWTTPVRWWLLATFGSAVGLRHWWDVVTWEPQSAAFHEVVTWLLAAIPPTLFLACAAAEGVRRALRRWKPSVVRESTALPDEEQDALAAAILAEIDDERRWAASFERSLDLLAEMAAGALAEHRAGRTEPFDPEQM